MKFMDKLPTVISCCFCCFLRAGSVMIGLVSFIAGLILAPNVSHSHGYWDLHGAIFTKEGAVEAMIQSILGCISIVLCVVSVCLVVGALCNIPKLIYVYQWGALFYSMTVFALFFILMVYCLAVRGNCAVAAGSLVVIMILNALLTTYFIIVVNSLRMSLIFLSSSSLTL
ncbi:uncharacterized protein LOC113232645 [Hyposmocoma kahamanoa]|uniref:uncharacterized protein LOC113232645 n=1 Tax=Hyposmocoma kahamanoa TaxID=1477025 RepID=UPI000E6D73A6|nr:uncharacterized protein LOC113232645 [Hyposmocoma kahamanoa]